MRIVLNIAEGQRQAKAQWPTVLMSVLSQAGPGVQLVYIAAKNMEVMKMRCRAKEWSWTLDF